jgi:hypothetical protein
VTIEMSEDDYLNETSSLVGGEWWMSL